MTVTLSRLETTLLDKICAAVVIGSELYGESVAIARCIHASGMLIQTNDIQRLGTIVTVHFHIGDTDDEIVARAEVVDLLVLNEGSSFAARGMWLRVLDFDENLPLSLPGSRVLH